MSGPDPGRERPTEMGIYLGFGASGWAFSGAERSTLVLGPSRSGKTSSVIIPNVIAAPGAVVSTSTKPDVLSATARARGEVGWTMLFDPSGTVESPPGVLRVGWSPVQSSHSWDGALSVGAAMVRSTRRGGRGSWAPLSDDHWSERAASLISPLLHAAALADEPLRKVLSWIDRHDGSTPLRILSDHVGDQVPATDVLAGLLATDEREQSGIWSTASGVFSAYRSQSALASTEPPFLDAAAFSAGANTLYVCSAGQQQQLLAPLVVGILGDIRDATYRRATAGTPGRPVLFALDEAANIAPLPDLPAIVSEGAGQGLLALVCLQDLSQARSRWGAEADGFLSLFGTTMVLGGIADHQTLESLSALAGDVELATRTVGLSRGAGRSTHASLTTSSVFRKRLPVDVVARGQPGAALALDSRNRLGWVQLTPAHATWPWRELVSSRDGPAMPRERAGLAARHGTTPALER
jgi:type IV secretion system protein VirD4